MNNSVRISLSVARYIITVATSIVSHLHGHEYDPSTGTLSHEPNDYPALYPQQTDQTIISFMSAVSGLLRMVAGILQHEVEINEAADILADMNGDEESGYEI